MGRWLVLGVEGVVLEIVAVEIIVMGNPLLRLSDANKKGLI